MKKVIENDVVVARNESEASMLSISLGEQGFRLTGYSVHVYEDGSKKHFMGFCKITETEEGDKQC